MSQSAGTVIQARNRAWQYWNTDGLSIMVFGFASLLQGIAYLWDHHERRSIGPIFLIVLSLWIYVDHLFWRKIVGWLKARITYPRTGYVAIPSFMPTLTAAGGFKLSRRAIPTVIFITFFCALIGFTSISYPRWSGALAAIPFAVFTWFRRMKDGPRGIFALYHPLPLLCCSLVLILGRINNNDAMFITLIGLGAQFILIGATQLSRYLREHPVPQA